MSKAKPKGGVCGAKTRSGGKCGHPKGYGTDHPGTGPCKFHGGSTPNGKKAAAKEAALVFAREALGSEVSIDPLDALLLSVRLAAGQVNYWRAVLASNENGVTARDEIARYEDAVGSLNRFSKAAVDAGVDQKLVAIAERYGEAVVAALEEALTVARLSFLNAEQRTQLARAFEIALAKREPAQLPPG